MTLTFSVSILKSMEVSNRKLSIIKAGFVVFSELGKSKASMSNIAKLANVSKPLLFHHFGNKEKLYKACLHFANQQLLGLKKPTLQNQSFIQVLKDIQVAKFTLEKTYPGIFKFALLEQTKIPDIPPTPFTPEDLKRMKKSVHPDQFWKLLYYLSLGYQSALHGHKEADELIKDYQQSFAILEAFVFAKED